MTFNISDRFNANIPNAWRLFMPDRVKPRFSLLFFPPSFPIVPAFMFFGFGPKNLEEWFVGNMQQGR